MLYVSSLRNDLFSYLKSILHLLACPCLSERLFVIVDATCSTFQRVIQWPSFHSWSYSNAENRDCHLCEIDLTEKCIRWQISRQVSKCLFLKNSKRINSRVKTLLVPTEHCNLLSNLSLHSSPYNLLCRI